MWPITPLLRAYTSLDNDIRSGGQSETYTFSANTYSKLDITIPPGVIAKIRDPQELIENPNLAETVNPTPQETEHPLFVDTNNSRFQSSVLVAINSINQHVEAFVYYNALYLTLVNSDVGEVIHTPMGVNVDEIVGIGLDDNGHVTLAWNSNIDDNIDHFYGGTSYIEELDSANVGINPHVQMLDETRSPMSSTLSLCRRQIRAPTVPTTLTILSCLGLFQPTQITVRKSTFSDTTIIVTSPTACVFQHTDPSL